jgi:hypothetical protein
MYDTITLWLASSETELALENLSGAAKRVNKQTGEVYQQGNLKNMRVAVKADGLLINGSLAKFHFGDNFHCLNLFQTAAALTELSDLIKIPLQEGRIYRLDVAACMKMEKPIPEYLMHLGVAPRFKRSEYNDLETLEYKNDLRTLSFYDKCRESKSHRQAIPQDYQGENVLRYEAQFKKRLPVYFTKPVYVKDLTDKPFFLQAVKKWENAYFTIHRQNLENGEVDFTTGKTFIHSLAGIGLNQAGGERVIIQQLKSAPLQKYKRARIRGQLRRLISKNQEKIPEVIGELDRKIQEKAGAAI